MAWAAGAVVGFSEAEGAGEDTTDGGFAVGTGTKEGAAGAAVGAEVVAVGAGASVVAQPTSNTMTRKAATVVNFLAFMYLTSLTSFWR